MATPTMRKLYVKMVIHSTDGQVWLQRDRRAKGTNRLIGPYTTTTNAKRAAAALGLTVRG